MKKVWVVVVVLVLIAGIAYLGRHQIKSLLGGSSSLMPAVQEKISPTASAMAPSNNIYQVKTDSAKGQYLTDFQGMTLYTFDKDTTGVSNCAGGCLVAWPAYTSGATAQSQFPANISVITRSDGSKQFAWKGMPLYYYASDKKAGDLLGDGVGGIWHIVKP